MDLANNTLVSKTTENLYDAYSPMLFGIALELTSSENKAEEILIATFRKINNQLIEGKSSIFNSATLVKLVIGTAYELHNQTSLKKVIKVKPLETHPLLQSLLCENISIDEYCKKNQVLKAHALQQLRQEFLHQNV
jgi:hypothetical protein